MKEKIITAVFLALFTYIFISGEGLISKVREIFVRTEQVEEVSEENEEDIEEVKEKIAEQELKNAEINLEQTMRIEQTSKNQLKFIESLEKLNEKLEK